MTVVIELPALFLTCLSGYLIGMCASALVLKLHGCRITGDICKHDRCGVRAICGGYRAQIYFWPVFLPLFLPVLIAQNVPSIPEMRERKEAKLKELRRLASIPPPDSLAETFEKVKSA